jgi:beta-lactam-binding protein with PASTA domain
MRRRRPLTEVPDVVGLGSEDACEVLRRAKLVPRGPEGASTPGPGVVVAQAPVAPAGAEEGSNVVLWTQLGPEPTADLLPPTPTESALQPA